MAYYLADVLVRGSDASILVSTTALAGVVLGIGAGVILRRRGGGAVDHPSSVMRAVGIALLPAVFLAEAAHQMIRHLTTDADSRPYDLVSTSIVLIVLAAPWSIWQLHGRGAGEQARTLGVTLALAAVGSVAYAVLAGRARGPSADCHFVRRSPGYALRTPRRSEMLLTATVPGRRAVDADGATPPVAALE